MTTTHRAIAEEADAGVKNFVIEGFHLQSGVTMPAVTIAYRTLGVLAPDFATTSYWSPTATPAARR